MDTMHFKTIALAGAVAAFGASGASALTFEWANAVTSSRVADTDPIPTFRDDLSNATGSPNASATGGFFSLGLGEYADFTFASGGPFTGASIVFEFTNDPVGNFDESANVFAFLASDGAPGTNSSSEASFVTDIPNENAQGGFTFDVASPFDTIRLWDTTADAESDGFDVDAVGVVPLPAAAWLLLGVTGGLIAAKRRHARRDA